jgi:uncharacterized tellurite resistance protein B-like protein
VFLAVALTNTCLNSYFSILSNPMDIVTKKQLNILIQLAEADKHFAKSEREIIFRIAKERNFPESEVQELIRNPEPIESLGALSSNQKLDYLMSAMELIFVDHNVFESEIIFCKSLAIKLGFKKSVIEFLLDNYEKLSPEKLKAAIMTQFL